MALAGPGAARDDHDVRGRPQAGEELRHAGDGRRAVAGAALADERTPNRPGSTILMSAEDDPARTIVPRLRRLAPTWRRFTSSSRSSSRMASEILPSLRADVDAITAAAARLGDCRLIVIDPVSAYLKGVDDNRNAALRGVLTPLKTLAERLGAAVVLVSHLTKGGLGQRQASRSGLDRLRRGLPRQLSVRCRSRRTQRAGACSCSIMAAMWLPPPRVWLT